MRLGTVVLLAACCAVAGAGARAQTANNAPAMSQAAKAFYRVYESFRPPDGIPDAAIRARFGPTISPALDKLLADAAAAQAHFASVMRNPSPLVVEGDVFTPNFEGATSFDVVGCAEGDRGGRCTVELVYDNGKDKPVRWDDTVLLVRTDAGWRVNEIVYGGNRGRLTDTLKGAIEAGSDAK